MHSIQDLVPSIKVQDDLVSMSLGDFKGLIQPKLNAIPFDEEFYRDLYPDVAEATDKGVFKSCREHFLLHGFFEGRLSSAPFVDTNWYLKTYPDVAEGVRRGDFPNAFQHYIRAGHTEGRLPRPPL